MNIEKPLPNNSVKSIIGIFANTISAFISKVDTYEMETVYGLGSNGCVFLVKNEQNQQVYALKLVNLSYYMIDRFGLHTEQIHEEVYNRFQEISEQIRSSEYRFITHPHDTITTFKCAAEQNSFFREFETLKRLIGTNKTAYLLDYGYLNIESESNEVRNFDYEIPYIVMPFIQGNPLTHYIQMSMSPVQRLINSLQWSKEIIEIISVIHQRGVIHRDLYSNNFLYNCDTENVYLIDFGASIPLGHRELDTPGERRGARRFMSPEQYKNPSDVDFRSDYFFIGALMFYSLTKVTPFNRSRNATTLPLRFKGTYRDKIKLSKDASNTLCNFIDKLMEYSPEKRFQTIDEIRIAFENMESKIKGDLM